MENFELLKNILAALAVGLLVGTERGWSERKEEEGLRVAGLRTFSLIGLLGGVWAVLSRQFGDWILFASFGVISLLIIVGHVMDARKTGDMGTTTAFSMMLTFSLAAWAALGYYVPAFITTVVVVALLGMKPVLHKWLRDIETEEAYAGIKLLIISVIFLPLLPNQGYGPWDALNPYWIWWMVVLISGISLVGYFAIKYVGNRWGTLVTSITGGLASSTAVTVSLSQFAREHDSKALFMSGVMVASSIMFIRMMVEVAVVNASLLVTLALPVLIMFVSVLVAAYWLWYKAEQNDVDTELHIKNPFKLGMALKFGALLAVILVMAEGMKTWFGDQGIYLLSLISGLMDVDAIALSLSRMALVDLTQEVATLGIVIAAATNTIVKGFIFAFFAGFKESLKFIGLLFLSVIPGLVAAFLLVAF
ncbi:MAG: MgtC/SapB family protein [Balneolaceae bacterium]|nr:MgtC/SapB family protein [Balneolaceae bacterium]MDR9407514.1 MgtC/SapB family protein [Balneolaceae bacterium]